MSKMNINTIGEALTGHIIQLDQLDGDKLRFEDNSIIKKGFEGSRQFLELTNPNKTERKLKVSFRKDAKFNIKSDLMKRLELEHIDEMIESLTIIPDFGFAILPMNQD